MTKKYYAYAARHFFISSETLFTVAVRVRKNHDDNVLKSHIAIAKSQQKKNIHRSSRSLSGNYSPKIVCRLRLHTLLALIGNLKEIPHSGWLRKRMDIFSSGCRESPTTFFNVPRQTAIRTLEWWLQKITVGAVRLRKKKWVNDAEVLRGERKKEME